MRRAVDDDAVVAVPNLVEDFGKDALSTRQPRKLFWNRAQENVGGRDIEVRVNRPNNVQQLRLAPVHVLHKHVIHGLA